MYYIYFILDITKPHNCTFKKYIIPYKPIYIGKGKGKRFLESCRNNNSTISFIISDLTEKEALEMEQEAIKQFSIKGLNNKVYNKGYRTNDSKYVYQYDLKGNLIKKHKSLRDAESYINSPKNSSGVCRACRLHRIYKEFIWVYEKNQYENALKNALNIRSKTKKRLKTYNEKRKIKVMRINIKTKEEKTYDSFADAAKDSNCENKNVSQSVKTGGIVFNKFTFKKL